MIKLKELLAYHGTGHNIDGNFSIEKIGTGEGEAVFGWGLYFAQEKEVGQFYAKKLSKNSVENVYTVHIEISMDNFLDWDKLLNQQSEKVQKIIDRILNTHTFSKYPLGLKEKTITGEVFYKSLTPSPKHSSMFLLKAGIPGIKYLDMESRNNSKKTYNFVLFDGKYIKILAVNGKPVNRNK